MGSGSLEVTATGSGETVGTLRVKLYAEMISSRWVSSIIAFSPLAVGVCSVTWITSIGVV